MSSELVCSSLFQGPSGTCCPHARAVMCGLLPDPILLRSRQALQQHAHWWGATHPIRPVQAMQSWDTLAELLTLPSGLNMTDGQSLTAGLFVWHLCARQLGSQLSGTYR